MWISKVLTINHFLPLTEQVTSYSWYFMSESPTVRIVIIIFRNRRSREASILKAIEDGAKTLFDIVAYVYSDVDRSVWMFASSNVRLHVDHLAQQHKLPKVITNMLQASNALNIFEKFLVSIGEKTHLAFGRIGHGISDLFSFLCLAVVIFIHCMFCISPFTLPLQRDFYVL